mmetsp:Transcript_9811/g.11308  ORF Transcript_9811/g.11308 Transcript_9811/m.11308 type:complete len:226 (-) Transcript_9811:26-703(-)
MEQRAKKMDLINKYINPSLNQIEEKGSAEVNRVYISLYWTLKWNVFSNPGAVCNLDVGCKHGALQPCKDVDSSRRVLAVSMEVWRKLCSYYGPGVMLKTADVCQICLNHKLDLEQRRKQEHEQVQNDDTKKDTVWYLISTHWVTQWRNFVQNNQPKTGRGTWLGVPPPGEVDNSVLLDKNGNPKKNLKLALHYRGINKKVWDFFISSYGGGPVIVRHSLNIYEDN